MASISTRIGFDQQMKVGEAVFQLGERAWRAGQVRR